MLRAWMVVPAFPLASHFAATLQSGAGASLAVGLLILPWLFRTSKGLVMRMGAVALLAAAAWSGLSLSILELIPVLVPFVLMVLFGRSLLPGHVALVTRMAERMDGPLPEQAVRYTRAVTQAWVALFAVMGVESAWLALSAPVDTWSLFTNGLNYLVLGSAFLIEFMVRQRVLHLGPGYSLVAFMRKLGKIRMAECRGKER